MVKTISKLSEKLGLVRAIRGSRLDQNFETNFEDLPLRSCKCTRSESYDRNTVSKTYTSYHNNP